MSLADEISDLTATLVPNAPFKRPTRTKSQQLRAHIARGGCYIAVSVQVEHRERIPGEPDAGVDILRTPEGKGSVITRKAPKKLSKRARHRAEVAARAR